MTVPGTRPVAVRPNRLSIVSFECLFPPLNLRCNAFALVHRKEHLAPYRTYIERVARGKTKQKNIADAVATPRCYSPTNAN